MASTPPKHGLDRGTPQLRRRRGLTAATMVVERLWPLVLPILLVVGLFLASSWFGLFRMVPDMIRIGALAAFCVAALVALYPLRFFRQPTRAEIDRRIEASNQLLHAPVRTQTDQLTGSDDPFASALWREHQRRMAAQLGSLSGDLPNTRVPERDPWGLRAVVALLLVIAFAFSAGPYGGGLFDAFRSRPGVEAVPPRIDAWVTPPGYTGKAPIFLTADANREQSAFIVPTGSQISVRVTGGSGTETLDYIDVNGQTRAIEPGVDAKAAPETAAARVPATPVQTTGTLQFSATLVSEGELVLSQNSEALGRWQFAVTPDNPPTIRFSEDPKQAANGSLELSYALEDDYGVASAQALITPAEPPAQTAHPLYDAPEMPLSLPRRGETERKTVRDLTQHPWAGTEVDLTLKAVDGAGQEGVSEPKAMRLPERRFNNPIARALIEQRRILAMDAANRPAVLELMDAITLRPEDTFEELSNYLGIMSARTRLQMARDDDQLRDVVDYLWDIALTIEDGALSSAEKRLKQAQQALKDALENGASDEEIEQRMAELREAMNEFLKEFAQRAQPNMAQEMPSDMQALSQRDLERMMNQIEDLAKSGQKDAAQQMLSQLEQMMNNLQAGRAGQQQQGGQQQNAMRQQMDKLGEIMRRQQEMMNETFRLDQMQRGQQGQQGQEGQDGQQGQRGQQGQQGQQGQGGQGGQGQPMSPQELAEALEQLQQGQGQLQQELQQLQESLRGMGVQPGEGFGQAGEAMGRAEGALGSGEGERATGEQGNALEALRRGAQDMMQQMQQAQQGEEGQDGQGQPGGRQRSADRDPLGRPRATTGPDFGNSVEVPDVIDAQRARQILDEIRRRLGNALSPQLEREYLERLLDLR
ncbi:TIGR02302 family protein [Tianweitania sp. BSSL-BM11]|uniref:TIGR02302 family protein n=1 Tax=Tianweitania aestuarii TaxID=2814886 RepID=A0ABS5RZC1_9HYPH|nr:TIGR02302 family protein [Tianweitania aestuarii]MBS9722391.1 TIGR02302 family protein [Tianweitania aestuarii]